MAIRLRQLLARLEKFGFDVKSQKEVSAELSSLGPDNVKLSHAWFMDRSMDCSAYILKRAGIPGKILSILDEMEEKGKLVLDILF